MKASYLNLILAPLFVTACAHSTPAPEERVETPGKLQKADPIFVQRDPDSKNKCKADSECPMGDYCHPDQLVCFQSYPNPGMLDISFNPQPECKIVNVYFPFDSVELVPEAARWLEYNIRCFKSRGVKAVHLDAFCDARGTQDYNLDLSKRRAAYVKQILEQKGLDVPITMHGEGEHHPIRTGKSEQDYAFNRRVEFKIE